MNLRDMVLTMKSSVFRFILLLFPLLFLCYCHLNTRPGADYTGTLPPVSVPDTHIDPSSTDFPSLRLYASGACLMDADSGRILYGKEENTPLPMASTTKIMTCLLALENGTMSDIVTFSDRAASMPKVHLGAGSGSSFSLESLLYSLMLESHNDSAVAIAEHIGGSVEEFAAMMNRKAAELGMSQTTFVTPNGLDAEGHASTPADMCRLAAYACQNPQFLRLVQAPSKTIQDANGRSFSLTNHDAFLSSYEGALGIKTGFTGKAGYCFVGAASREKKTFVSCVLASGWPPNKSYKWADTKCLMNFGFEKFTYQTLPIRDLSSIYIGVQDGKTSCVTITTPQTAPVLLSPYDSVDIEYQIPSSLEAPVRKKTAIGSVKIYINETLSASYPVYPQENVDKQNFSDLLYYNLNQFFSF